MLKITNTVTDSCHLQEVTSSKEQNSYLESDRRSAGEGSPGKTRIERKYVFLRWWHQACVWRCKRYAISNNRSPLVVSSSECRVGTVGLSRRGLLQGRSYTLF